MENHTDEVIVVSGFPRSGTSLMMQMLHAAGIPLLVDQARPQDEHNPRGYFEYEPVQRTRRDASWVAQAAGKAVKVIHLLLPHLPDGFRYRVIFMGRSMAEVIASQRTMLEKQSKTGAAIDDERLARVFAQQLEAARSWLSSHENVGVLDVRYRELVTDPSAAARRVDAFLGGGFDTAAMADVVDPALYRQRCGDA